MNIKLGLILARALVGGLRSGASLGVSPVPN
jgi:hypothetical protein